MLFDIQQIISRKHKSAKPRLVQQHVGITTISLDESMYMHVCVDTLSDLNKKYYF